MSFKKGDKVYCLGNDRFSWAKGKTAVVNKESTDIYGWIQVRFDDISKEEYKTEDNGHSGPSWCFIPLTKLHKALK